MKCTYPDCDYNTDAEIAAAPRTEKFSHPKLELKNGKWCLRRIGNFSCITGLNMKD